MRDRLIELLTNDLYRADNPLQFTSDEIVERIANMLLANGVIVPPCKVGDRCVFDTAMIILNTWNDVTGALHKGSSWYAELESVIEDIVKLSFGAGVLYREQAEQALKGGSDE